MKSLNLLLAGALTLGLWSCSSDEPAPDKGNDTKGDVFATLTLQLPNGRSVTDTTDDNGDYPAHSTNGNEVGKDYENNVNAIYVVLAKRDATTGAFTYAAKSYSSSVMNQAASKATFTIQFQSQELENVAKGTAAEREVYVFTYCNPTVGLKTYLDNLTSGDFIDETYTLSDGDTLPFALKNQFLMTNALLHKVTIDEYTNLIKNNNTVATAFPLGTVKVERVASRFDFEEKPEANGLPKNAYTIDDNASGLPVGYVEFTGMSLFNEAKEFYFIPRMAAADEDWTTTTDICGYELVDKYVVSPNYSLKNQFGAGTLDYDGIKDNYFFNIGAKPQDYTYSWVTTEDDNDDWTGASGTSYKIWRYASENTLPLAAQKYGVTTGVLFRAEMKALPSDLWGTVEAGGVNPAETFAAAINSHETIYAYTQVEEAQGNTTQKPVQVTTMLGTAKQVWQYAYTHKQSDIRTKFVAGIAAGVFKVTINGENKTTEDEIFPALVAGTDFDTMDKLLAAVKVTMPTGNLTNTDGAYIPSTNYNFVAYTPEKTTVEGVDTYHYYNYYYYFNRHNDNDNDQEDGIMEFATVRNNIYKLKLSKVTGFGQPGDVTVDPGHEDETPEVYFQVSALVLDWVVRVQDIEF